jgi:hypothetical protein
MKKFPFTNYFEMLFPILEPDEEEIIFRHPEHPMRVNQIGFISAEDGYSITLNHGNSTLAMHKEGASKGFTIGNRGKLIYECYHGKIPNGNAILNLNGNIYDFSIDNLFLRSDKDKYQIYTENRNKLINNSVVYMREKDKWLISKGYDVQKYWEFVDVPDAVFTPYKRHKDMVLSSNQKFKNKELLPSIISMYQSGSTQTEIKKALGMNNTSSVRFLLKKAKLL